MSTKRALQVVLAIGIAGMAFSGYLSWRELFGGAPACTIGPGGVTTLLGLPACVYGLIMYAAVTAVAALGLRGARRARVAAPVHA